MTFLLFVSRATFLFICPVSRPTKNFVTFLLSSEPANKELRDISVVLGAGQQRICPVSRPSRNFVTFLLFVTCATFFSICPVSRPTKNFVTFLLSSEQANKEFRDISVVVWAGQQRIWLVSRPTRNFVTSLLLVRCATFLFICSVSSPTRNFVTFLLSSEPANKEFRDISAVLWAGQQGICSVRQRTRNFVTFLLFVSRGTFLFICHVSRPTGNFVTFLMSSEPAKKEFRDISVVLRAGQQGFCLVSRPTRDFVTLLLFVTCATFFLPVL